ncbi:MAG: 2-oxo acid dehydrogenase subunit E2 [Myxococcales bacterium]
MPLFRRGDGELVTGAPPLRVLMPHLMPGRNESAVYFAQQLRIAGTQAVLAARAPGSARVGFFHVLLAALVRTLSERPLLNRFVVGRRLYQRRGIALSFAVKKAMSDSGALTTVKVRFDGTERLEAVASRVEAAVQEGRGERPTQSEREMNLVTRLPQPVLRLAMWAQRVLDGCNLLPDALTRDDPLYASAFVANLGSVGLDAPWHHLYEYGTVPLFMVIGRTHRAPVVEADGQLAVAEVVEVKYTLDERIADGFYCARSLERFRELVEDPALLL